MCFHQFYPIFSHTPYHSSPPNFMCSSILKLTKSI